MGTISYNRSFGKIFKQKMLFFYLKFFFLFKVHISESEDDEDCLDDDDGKFFLFLNVIRFIHYLN